MSVDFLTFGNFVTVCYREVDDKHLQNFQEELEAEGNMTEEVKEVIQQIQEAPRQPTNQPTQVGLHAGDVFSWTFPLPSHLHEY